MRIEHPRAARDLTPPDRVGIAPRNHASVDEDGYFEVDDDRADVIMSRFAESYDVEYTDDGEVVLPDDTPAEEDGPPDTDTADGSDADADVGDEADEGEFDLEAFLDQQYTDRADAVAAGEVDAHLNELEDAETSKTVQEAIAERRDELEE